MVNKLIEVDETKWKKFHLWCVNNSTTIKKEIDKFLDKFSKDIG